MNFTIENPFKTTELDDDMKIEIAELLKKEMYKNSFYFNENNSSIFIYDVVLTLDITKFKVTKCNMVIRIKEKSPDSKYPYVNKTILCLTQDEDTVISKDSIIFDIKVYYIGGMYKVNKKSEPEIFKLIKSLGYFHPTIREYLTIGKDPEKSNRYFYNLKDTEDDAKHTLWLIP